MRRYTKTWYTNIIFQGTHNLDSSDKKWMSNSPEMCMCVCVCCERVCLTIILTIKHTIVFSLWCTGYKELLSTLHPHILYSSHSNINVPTSIKNAHIMATSSSFNGQHHDMAKTSIQNPSSGDTSHALKLLIFSLQSVHVF